METKRKSKIVVVGIVLLLMTGLKAAPIARDVGTGPLLFTEQILPTDESGTVTSPGQAFGQIKYLLAKAEDLLGRYGTGLDRAARMHLYVVSSEVEEKARKVTEIFPETPVTWVVTSLPHSDAMIGIDVVAPTDQESVSDSSAAVLPSGVRYFVSGQAAREKDLEAATKGTMEQLQGTLQEYGRSLADAVQIKSFLKPMSDIEVARKAIVSFFPEGQVPPLVFVEWQSTLPIEIELVAGGGEPGVSKEPIEYLTPEGMTASPVFCRVTRVNDVPLVYVSGLDGDPAAAPHDQVKAVFQTLETLLQKESSDLRHLAKATYYVANSEVSKALNDQRPDYYDPERPPAASKAMVAGGGGGGSLTVDMIAVGKGR